jgi:hypothetical protein
MHKVAKPEQVVRAVGVYEWTGDMTKPTASRLIPVSIFIEGKLEDAGVYVARPVPFALLSGNVYELQDAGVDKAMLDLAFARHLQAENATGDLAYDDGWFGYGSVKPLAVAKLKPATKLKPSKTLPVLMSSTGPTSDSSRPQMVNKTPGGGAAGSGDAQSKTTSSDAGTSAGTTSASTDDPDRPTMKRRSDSSGTAAGGTDTTGGTTSTTASAAGSTPADDSDRPTMKRRSDSSGTTAGGADTTGGTTSSTASTTGSAPADDPDRPTMKRRTSDSSDSAGDSTTASSSGSGGTPADDPDRPTLKRHSAEDAKRARNNDVATVSGTGSLNDDPDRPNLHRGKPTSAMTETELPKLVGMPVDLHQMVAVSDAVNRDPHEFTLAFEDATQRAAVLQKMQAMARAQLAAYKGVPAPATAPAKTVAKVTATTATKSRRAAAPAAAPVALMDEELKAYTLSYGGAATYVYSAHTAGTGSALRYVTIVAQADGLGELKPAIQSVTDAAHLDRTPRMRFVDVVDVEASNRASLLFELRGQNARQFGLYRVIAAHSEQIFLTGTTQ